jgi:hypothetical protein
MPTVIPTWHDPDVLIFTDAIAPGLSTTLTIEEPAAGFLAVVGESHYQDALRRLTASWPGDDAPVFLATLMAENDNRYDATAVAVVIEPAGKVGHLARDIARRYWPILKAQGPVKCPAQLRGGYGEKPSIGVVLDPTRAEPRLPSLGELRLAEADLITEWHRQRNATTALIEETRLTVEPSDRRAAIDAYRRALDAIRAYESYALQHACSLAHVALPAEKWPRSIASRAA